MKYKIVVPPKTLALALGCLCGAFLLTGCNTTTFKSVKPDGTSIEIINKRVFWSTDQYSAVLTTNGASLTASKSNVDSAAIAASVGAAVDATAKIMGK